MASIIKKEDFISKYLIGSESKDFMLFNLDRVSVGVKEHKLHTIGSGIDFLWSYSRVNTMKYKNKVILESYKKIDNEITPFVSICFPAEMDKNGVIECFDEFSNKIHLSIYEKVSVV